MVNLKGRVFTPKSELTIRDLIKIEEYLGKPISALTSQEQSSYSTLMSYCRVAYNLDPADVEFFLNLNSDEFSEACSEMMFVLGKNSGDSKN